MARNRTIYVCQNCGAEAAKWIGKCPSCGQWNSYVEEIISKNPGTGFPGSDTPSSKPVHLDHIPSGEDKRIDTGISELNRVLGGGIVPGSLILVGGEPGIGKSTLALQIAMQLSTLKVLYVSAEESTKQIKLRSERIGNTPGENLYVLSEVVLEHIFLQIQQLNPDLIIVDSVQTVYSESLESSPGSISQVRDCASRFLKFAKESSVPVILVGHITKDGTLAGPKILEHIVDCVLLFEGDHNHVYRILRASKNRFGATSELGIFEMHEKGLIEVNNPSEILLSKFDEELSGMATASTIDGLRPFLIEVQALVSTAAYGTPQRSSTGFDVRRLNMLLAVLEKRAGFKIAAKDVFLNIAGGIKVTDPAIDLAVVSAVISSGYDRAIDRFCCFAGEIGLSGEIRPVSRIEQRIKEADKMGFTKIIISGYNNLKSVKQSKIKILTANKIEQALRLIFSKDMEKA